MKKILLIDDDPFILDVYSRQLKKDGYRVDLANTAETAMKKILDNGLDALVLDLNLDTAFPGPHHGLDFLKNLRQNPRTKNLKVLVMSNYNMSDYPEMKDIASLGVLNVLLKVENNPEELSRHLSNVFHESK